MAGHEARIIWQAAPASVEGDAEYSRDHRWEFPGGESLAGSAAESFGGSAGSVDPEQGLVASLSSCHMLTFLAMAHKYGFKVARYEDNADGEIGRNDDGRNALTRVILNPVIEFSGEKRPDAAALKRLHDSAHKYCFIANSVCCEVVING